MENKFMRLVARGIFTSCIIFSLPLSAEVFDDNRAGFISSIGVGFHNIDYKLDFGYIGIDDSKNGIATSLKIGYGFSEQFALYYIRNVSYYKPADHLFLSGLMGIGATYYILPSTETSYISAAVGVGDFTDIDESASENGSSFMFGIGYEIKKHIQIEADIMRTNIADYADLKTTSLQLTVNYNWY